MTQTQTFQWGKTGQIFSSSLVWMSCASWFSLITWAFFPHQNLAKCCFKKIFWQKSFLIPMRAYYIEKKDETCIEKKTWQKKLRNEQGHWDLLLKWTVRHNLSLCGRSEIYSARFMTITFKYSLVTDGRADGSEFTEGRNEDWIGLAGSNRAISLSLI